MSRVLFALCLFPVVARAEDPSPRQLVEKAVRASGLSRWDQPLAVRYRYKFTSPAQQQAVLEVWGETHSSRCRVAVSEDGNPLASLFVSNGDRCWMQTNGRDESTESPACKIWQSIRYNERITWLVPLLVDRKFTLAPLGRSEHNGRAVLGVKVSYPDRPDASLFFDPETGALVKAHLVREGTPAGGATLLVQEFRDRQPWDGCAGDEQALAQAGVAADGPALVEFLRRQTPDPARTARVALLVRRLGDDSFAQREKATTALRRMGPAALSPLRKAAAETDPEVAHRARDLVGELSADGKAALVPAVVRLLAQKKPAGAAEVLRGRLDHCADSNERQEVLSALLELDGKTDAALAEAAKAPGRRLYLPGLKLARRIVVTEEKTRAEKFELELVEFGVFNRHDPALFVPPAPGPRGWNDNGLGLGPGLELVF